VLLRAEIKENRDFIQARLPEMDERTRIRRDLLLPKVALDAGVSDLGYFPLPLAQAVIRVYHEYEKILRAYPLEVGAFYETAGPKEPEERLTSNFRASRRVLAEHMQLGQWHRASTRSGRTVKPGMSWCGIGSCGQGATLGHWALPNCLYSLQAMSPILRFHQVPTVSHPAREPP
jgi:hypothetical protein